MAEGGRMKRYFCEYCGTTFHRAIGPAGCVKLPVCRALNFPPAAVEGNFRIRSCAIVLAKTAGDMLCKSPAARSCVRTREIGQRIINWSNRAYLALEANYPISLGRAAVIQSGLALFVQKNLWSNKLGIPNLHILELAAMYVDAAKIFVQDMIDSGEHRHFWFEKEHAEWLIYDAVSMPLAEFISGMKKRGHTSKELDGFILGHGRKHRDGPPTQSILECMLDHCWRDELRSWNYLEGVLTTASRHIREHGTDASNDLSKFDTLEAFNKLYDYIWGVSDESQEAKKDEKPLRLWVVNDRFWVAAREKGESLSVLTKDTGHVARMSKGVDLNKKLYDSNGNEAGTARDLLAGISEPQFIGLT